MQHSNYERPQAFEHLCMEFSLALYRYVSLYQQWNLADWRLCLSENDKDAVVAEFMANREMTRAKEKAADLYQKVGIEEQGYLSKLLAAERAETLRDAAALEQCPTLERECA